MTFSRFVSVLLLPFLIALRVQNGFAGDLPINLIPMYGFPEVTRSEGQKKADDAFIETVTKNSGSRQLAAKEFAQEAWSQYQKGDLENAMRRFNQSWLLDPESFMPYWGFGNISLKLFKMEESLSYYERSLSLIDSVTEKPLLLTDTAKAYWLASVFSAGSGGSKKEALRAKAETMFQQAVQIDPKYSKSYNLWIDFYFTNKEYSKAWEVVHKARKAGIQDLPHELLNLLEEKMPEPQS